VAPDQPDRSFMNLKPRFLLLTLLLVLISSVGVLWSVRMLAEGIVAQWAVRYAEKQVLYDKSRTLQPLLREIALSRQLADSPRLHALAKAPDDAAVLREALAEMESFRRNFSDNSYFVAYVGSAGSSGRGRYYHNNAANEYAGRELRYQLDAHNSKDAWFFDLVRINRDLHINVSPDPELGVVKLWIDVLMRDGDKVLGIAGSGLDLTDFLKNVVEEGTPGITSLFVDHGGAIQLHRDQTLIDFASISNKRQGGHKNLSLLFENPADQEAVRAAMLASEQRPEKVVSAFVQIGGRRHLAGIAHVPEIDWYEITLLDLDVLLPPHYFYVILGLYVGTMLLALILFNLVLNRLVLTPLGHLERAMAHVADGQDPMRLDYRGAGEVRRLVQHFTQMAASVLQARRDLEHKVSERTAALDRLTKIDPMTELFNRRGMSERLTTELERARREHSRVGLLWLDVDWFKTINDGYGHAVGDAALRLVALTIQSLIRPYDVAARWGGDEFVVLLQGATPEALKAMGERLCAAVAAAKGLEGEPGRALRLSVSVGGHLALPEETLDSVLNQADQALYAAKAAGRGCYRSSAVVHS
jgi:diguanylate cyclase (GGDEF)-like protein